VPTTTNLPIGLVCGLLVLLARSPGTQATGRAVAGQQDGKRTITVCTTGGRTFTAELDPRTHGEQLWLRWQRGSAVLLRAIRWDQVVQVRLAGHDLSGGEFHAIIEKLGQDLPAQPKTPANQKSIVLKGSTRSGGPDATGSTASGRPPATPRVCSLAIEAVTANWDADVEADGLLLHVYPRNVGGRVVPVRGMLEVELTGKRLGVVKRPQPFERLGRWTRQVACGDFAGPAPAVYRLPFTRVHPEFNPAFWPHGAVHARLSVPGQGTFETTDSTVRIRPYSAVRDQLQQATGRRFFPRERTGR